MARKLTRRSELVVTSPVTTVTTAGFDAVRAFIRASKAPSTVAGYTADWKDFLAWCEKHGRAALPAAPETVADYIAQCADHLKPGSIQRRLNAISEAHKAVGYDEDLPTHSGVVRNVMKGIRRTLGTKPVQKAPVLTGDVCAMVAAADPGLIGIRDRAIVLIGFAGAFRRSEIVGLNVDDLDFGKDGLVITVRRSKTDQEGKGQKVGVMAGQHPATCPIRAVREWLRQARIKS